VNKAYLTANVVLRHNTKHELRYNSDLHLHKCQRATITASLLSRSFGFQLGDDWRRKSQL